MRPVPFRAVGAARGASREASPRLPRTRYNGFGCTASVSENWLRSFGWRAAGCFCTSTSQCCEFRWGSAPFSISSYSCVDSGAAAFMMIRRSSAKVRVRPARHARPVSGVRDGGQKPMRGRDSSRRFALGRCPKPRPLPHHPPRCAGDWLNFESVSKLCLSPSRVAAKSGMAPNPSSGIVSFVRTLPGRGSGR